MLRGIPFEISPQMLRVLAEMGHGDRICIGDAYYPANSTAEQGRLLRADGHDLATLVNVILQLMPLDNWAEYSVIFMGKPDENGVPGTAPAIEKVKEVIARYDEEAAKTAKYVDRFEFYDLARKCFAVVSSGETENWGCIILQKGVK